MGGLVGGWVGEGLAVGGAACVIQDGNLPPRGMMKPVLASEREVGYCLRVVYA